MTVRHGDEVNVATLNQFMERFGVAYKEIVQALPEHYQEVILDNEIRFREKNDMELIDSLDEMSYAEIGENLLAQLSTGQMIHHTLEERDEEYVYTSEHSSFRIMELTPVSEDNPEPVVHE